MACGLIWLVFLIAQLYLIGGWLGEGKRIDIINTSFIRDWIMFLNFIDYSALNYGHNRKDLCIW